MPRVNLVPKGSKLARTLLGYARERNLYPSDLEKPGFSKCTIERRFKNPGEFQIDEILYLGRKLNIPIEELRECIHY